MKKVLVLFLAITISNFALASDSDFELSSSDSDSLRRTCSLYNVQGMKSLKGGESDAKPKSVQDSAKSQDAHESKSLKTTKEILLDEIRKESGIVDQQPKRPETPDTAARPRSRLGSQSKLKREDQKEPAPSFPQTYDGILSKNQPKMRVAKQQSELSPETPSSRVRHTSKHGSASSQNLP